MKDKDTIKAPKAPIRGVPKRELNPIYSDFASAIINNIGDPIFVKDEHSKILLVNDAFCELFGLERDHILGRTLAEDVLPDEQEHFLKIDRQVLKTGKENIIEESLTIREREAKTIFTRKTRYIDGNGKKYLIGIIRDITDRVNAEIELKKAQKIARVGNWYLDVMTGEMVWSEELYKMYGFDQKLPLAPLSEHEKYLTPESWELLSSSIEYTINTGKPYSIELQGAEGVGNNWKWILGRGEVVFDAKNKIIGIRGTAQDITLQKKAEENLKETLARLNLAVDTVKLGVWQLNIDSGELLWNDRHLEIYGITRKEFNDDLDGWRKQIHPDDKHYAESRFQEVYERKSIHDVNFRIFWPNGDIRYLSASATPIVVDGKLVKVIGVNQDITESKQSEKKLRESEERFRLFTQNVPDFLLQIDKTGKINYINRTLEGSTQDVIGSSVYSWIPEEFSEQFKKKLENIFSSGGSETIEHLAKGLNDEFIWFESQMGPLEKSGAITQVIIVSREITERKKAELELKRALKENIELKQQIEAENIYLKEELKLEGSFNDIVGSSKSLKKVLKQVERVAKTDSTVLILGETGTGKELIARAIHNASNRKDKPMVKVNCSALPAELIESELFGHEIGAFTSAVKRKIGRFELANRGTIFLDEIGDLPLGLQTRLLRVLQESEFERVGGEATIRVNVRVIAATNRDLKQEIVNGNFRQDLYYRLNVFPITCPPLRDRIEDIPVLVNHFVNNYNHKINKKIKAVNQKSIDKLINYKWPGNVRELENVIERAVIMNIGEQLRLGSWFTDNSVDNVLSDSLTTLEIVERNYIIKVLEITNWKIRGKNGASEILGLKPTTLESRMKKMDIRRS